MVRVIFISKGAELALLAFFAVMVYLIFFGFSFLSLFGTLWEDSSNQGDSYHIYSDIIHFRNECNEKYRTYRLIKMDVSYGIATSDIMRKSLHNVNQYTENVNNTWPYQRSGQGTLDYITFTKKILHNNFYSLPSVEFSNNYAIHRLDCDSNTYSMVYSLKVKGINSYIFTLQKMRYLPKMASVDNNNYLETKMKNSKDKLPT